LKLAKIGKVTLIINKNPWPLHQKEKYLQPDREPDVLKFISLNQR